MPLSSWHVICHYLYTSEAPNASAYNSLVSAFGSGSRWDAALHILGEMRGQAL